MNGFIGTIGTKTVHKHNSFIFCFTNRGHISCIHRICSYFSHSARVCIVKCAAHKFKGRLPINLWMPIIKKISIAYVYSRKWEFTFSPTKCTVLGTFTTSLVFYVKTSSPNYLQETSIRTQNCNLNNFITLGICLVALQKRKF